VPNPYTVQQRIDKQPHEIVAEAPGYQTVTRSIVFERDLTVMLGLAPVAQAMVTSSVASASSDAVPVATPTLASKTLTKGKPAGKCEPPYDVDANGIKTYKPECL
jgi:hypothetical protein